MELPGGTVGCSRCSLPQRRRPSPKFRRVGSRIALFEACSAFTHVTACILAESPYDPLHRRLRRFRCLRHRSDCYRPACRASGAGRLEQLLSGGTLTHWRSAPFHGALNDSGKKRSASKKKALSRSEAFWREGSPKSVVGKRAVFSCLHAQYGGRLHKKKRDPRPSHPYHVRGSQLGHPIALAEYTTSYAFCQQGFRAEQTGSRPGRPRPCCALSRSVPAALYPDASKKTRRLREVRVEHPGSNRHREKSPPENGTSPAGSDPAGLLCVVYVYGDPEGSRTPVAGLKARCPNR